MDLSKYLRGSRLGGKAAGILEMLGLAVLLTGLQLVILFVLFKVSLFEIYKDIFNSFLFPLDMIYQLVIALLEAILGESVVSNPIFIGLFERTFFVIFLVNLAYFAWARWAGKRG